MFCCTSNFGSFDLLIHIVNHPLQQQLINGAVVTKINTFQYEFFFFESPFNEQSKMDDQIRDTGSTRQLCLAERRIWKQTLDEV